MKKLLWIIVTICLVVGCSESYEETKRITRAQRLKAMREDSAALKVAVLPTLDCLPIYLAKEHQMFDTAVDIRLKLFTAQMDIDTALVNNRVEVGVSDLVRIERLKKQGDSLRYLTSTNAYWQLVTNRNARIKQLKQLEDKMVAMTRYSVTDMLADQATDSAKLDKDHVFKVQVNDVFVRMQMLQNNIMDALCFTEPQATMARQMKHQVVLDTRSLGWQMGVMAFNEKEMRRQARSKQLTLFVDAYNHACDSINKYGVLHYRSLIKERCRMKNEQIDELPKDMKYPHAKGPRQQDIDVVTKWLEKK
jgi:NitT/TauT family transport system substrate-binding protein